METKIIEQTVTAITTFPSVIVKGGPGVPHGYEIDQVRVRATWVEAIPSDGPDMMDQGEGWSIEVHPQGWPLTAKGVRRANARHREWLYRHSLPSLPEVVHEAARAAYEEVLNRGVRWQDVLGDDYQPGTTLTLI